MRKRVTYYAWFPMKVELMQPEGVPDECFNISINGYHYGRLVKRDGRWVEHLVPGAWKSLTIEDVRAMGDVIDDHFPDGTTDH